MQLTSSTFISNMSSMKPVRAATRKMTVTSKDILISIPAIPSTTAPHRHHHHLLIGIFQRFPAVFHLGVDLRGDYAVHFGILDAQFFHDVLESQLAFLENASQLLKPSTETQYLQNLGKSLALRGKKKQTGFPGSSRLK